MRKPSLAPLLVVLAAAFAPNDAEAVPVDVTYDIQVVINIPAFGAFPAFSGSGLQTLRFANGTPGGHVSAGPLQVMGGSAFVSGSFFVSMTFFSGTQHFVHTGGGGSVTAAGGFSLNVFNHVTQGFLHCHGANCASFGFVSSVPDPLTSFTQIFVQQGIFAGFPSLGPQSFSATGTAGTFGGAVLTVLVTGQEVGRSVVPEPGTGLLVGLGLAALGLYGPLVAGRRRASLD